MTAQICCFHGDYTACPEVQKFNLSNGTYKGKKWCNPQVQVGAPEILGMHKLRRVLERTGPTPRGGCTFTYSDRLLAAGS